MIAIDLAGQRFGRLTAISFHSHIGKQRTWLCRCDCQKFTVVSVNSLRTGNTTSCGCLRIEKITRHGKIGLPEYAIWKAAKQRCTNPKSQGWKRYGARGIRMCDRWLNDFGAFLSDMGKRPEGMTLDRVNNDGPYSPENCRWATTSEQAINRRSNHRLTWNGETLTIAEWSKRTGLRFNTIFDRALGGWPLEQILTSPPDRNRPRFARRLVKHGSSPLTKHHRHPAQPV